MQKENENNIRVQMESSVIGVNKHLKDRVKEMDDSQLFSNMHPYDREFFTTRIYANRPTNFRSEREGRRSYL